MADSERSSPFSVVSTVRNSCFWSKKEVIIGLLKNQKNKELLATLPKSPGESKYMLLDFCQVHFIHFKMRLPWIVTGPRTDAGGAPERSAGLDLPASVNKCKESR